MDVVLMIVGAVIVIAAFADLLNTLVTTSTSGWRWLPSQVVGYRLFGLVRFIARRMPEESRVRERILSSFGPLLILILLGMWITQQIVGFALIWYASDAVAGAETLIDAVYYSGVVFFTVGFGEVLPTQSAERIAALVEAGCGVVTTALVIGYLPSLYSAYSSREQKLMMIDDGSGDRVTPTALVIAWAPDADPDQVNRRLADWQEWVAGILETHSTLPLLQLFRSHDRRQNWVTALGLLADAAVHAQLIVGCSGRNESYWFLRRTVTLLDSLTEKDDLSGYQHHVVDPADPTANVELLRDLYDQLANHGFEMLPWEEAHRRGNILHNRFAPQLEYLIDFLLAPRGFWSTDIRLGIEDEDAAVLS